MKTTRKGKWPLESHWFSTISQRGNADAMASEIPFMASLPSHASEISLSTKILSRHPCGMGGASLPIPPPLPPNTREQHRVVFLHNPPLRFDQQSARPREDCHLIATVRCLTGEIVTAPRVGLLPKGERRRGRRQDVDVRNDVQGHDLWREPLHRCRLHRRGCPSQDADHRGGNPGALLKGLMGCRKVRRGGCCLGV
jgi:hypothetical protein